MQSRRWVSTSLVFAVLVSLLATVGSAFAADSIFIDFEQYASGTLLSRINEPGVTFQPGAGIALAGVNGGGPSGNYLTLLGEVMSSSLTIAVNPGASAISFDYMTTPWQKTMATFYQNGAVVDTFVLSAPMIVDVLPFFSFSYEGNFDTLVIDFAFFRPPTEMRGGSMISFIGVALDNIAITLGGMPASAPDDRLNWGYCDLKAVIYQRTGPDGGPALHVYGVDGASKGYFLLDVTGPDLAPYIANPPQGQNVLIEEAGNVQLYALISGEFSLHIHMDDQGNVCAWVFDGLPPTSTHVVNYNMYQ